jgi:hypothetical protein
LNLCKTVADSLSPNIPHAVCGLLGQCLRRDREGLPVCEYQQAHHATTKRVATSFDILAQFADRVVSRSNAAAFIGFTRKRSGAIPKIVPRIARGDKAIRQMHHGLYDLQG